MARARVPAAAARSVLVPVLLQGVFLGVRVRLPDGVGALVLEQGEPRLRCRRGLCWRVWLSTLLGLPTSTVLMSLGFFIGRTTGLVVFPFECRSFLSYFRSLHH